MTKDAKEENSTVFDTSALDASAAQSCINKFIDDNKGVNTTASQTLIKGLLEAASIDEKADYVPILKYCRGEIAIGTCEMM